MYLLDTDMFTLLVYNHPKAQAVASSKNPITLSIITRIEVLRGRFDTIMKAANKEEWLRAQDLLDRWEAALSEYSINGIDEACALEFERLSKIKSLRKIGRADLLIASIALAHGATVVTRNIKDFRLIRGLTIENWAD